MYLLHNRASKVVAYASKFHFRIPYWLGGICKHYARHATTNKASVIRLNRHDCFPWTSLQPWCRTCDYQRGRASPIGSLVRQINIVNPKEAGLVSSSPLGSNATQRVALCAKCYVLGNCCGVLRRAVIVTKSPQCIAPVFSKRILLPLRCIEYCTLRWILGDPWPRIRYGPIFTCSFQSIWYFAQTK